MKMPTRREILLVAVSIGALSFLLFSKATLAETFFFIASVIAIVTFYQLKQLHDNLEVFKKRTADRFQELEKQLEKSEKMGQDLTNDNKI